MGRVDVGDIAELEVARRKVKQAADLCRRASQRLAAAQTLDVYAVQHVDRDRGSDGARALIDLALTEHAHVDVVLLTSPGKHNHGLPLAGEGATHGKLESTGTEQQTQAQ